ncbi:NAD(P)H-dependent glycerol-3-phosphate dehydrogenase, partial [Lacticaseibacillus rhamnosus MTCC 5462]
HRSVFHARCVRAGLRRAAVQRVAPGAAAVRDAVGGKMLVSTTKGIEAESFMLMSQILEQIAPQARIGVL